MKRVKGPLVTALLKMNEKIILAKLKMIDAGVVPAFTGCELTEMLESMDAEKRRITKRKFRKQWRKMVKKEPHLKKMLTAGHGSEPSKAQKRNRSCIYIARMIDQIN